MEFEEDQGSSNVQSDDGSSSDDAVISAARCAVSMVMTIISNSGHRSLMRKTRKKIWRDRAAANKLLIQDYFATDREPTYNDTMFKRRFRMSRRLFTRIARDLEEHKPFFQQRADAAGVQGFTSLQKCTSAIRQLGYGTAADSWDDYLKMSEKVSRDSLEYFCQGINELYGYRYLRKPSFSDIQQIFAVHEEVHGFPGMLGSLDCMHWEWSNCPTAWRGSHKRGDHPRPTLMLEAVASTDLWIWHAFFGVAGSCNDINVLDQSNIFEYEFKGVAPGTSFYANDTYYKHGYYLTDGIYPEYAKFVKSFSVEAFDDEKRNHFKMKQEAARKDIERAFGVLKKKWHIISNPCRLWDKDKIGEAMYACIVLHNMILEDKGRAICQSYEDFDFPPSHLTEEEMMANKLEIRSNQVHAMLKADLVEHLWKNKD